AHLLPLLLCSVPRPDTHLPLPSFPTRRSSDLITANNEQLRGFGRTRASHVCTAEGGRAKRIPQAQSHQSGIQLSKGLVLELCSRSEEHTSELQSRFELVCRLLLEEKKETRSRV